MEALARLDLEAATRRALIGLSAEGHAPCARIEPCRFSGRNPSRVRARQRGISQLYLRAMDQHEAVPMRGTEGAQRPFFSHDGQWVGFYAEGS